MTHGLSRRVVGAAMLLCLAAVPAAASDVRRVLIVYDERTELPGLAILDTSMVHALTSGPAGAVEVYREAMDLSRFGSPGYPQLLRDFLRAKYAARPIDVVVAAMGPSLDFLVNGRDPVFPGVPIVFCGIDRREIERRALPGNVTGVLVKREFAPTLDLVLRLHPETTRIVFVAGASEFDNRLVEQARGEFRRYEGRVAFTYLTTLAVPDLLAQLKTLPPQTVILYSTMFRDGAGQSFVPHEVATRISTAANVPVYGFLDQYIGRGIVGGQVYSIEAHGQQAAALVRQILAGSEPSALPFGEGQAGVNAFDARQLRRWGISESRVPAGSRLQHRQSNAWELYRTQIIAGGLLILIQSGFIVALLIQRAGRRRIERALRESEERFRLMADTAPVLVWRTGVDKRYDFVNRSWLEFTGRTAAQELGDGWKDGVSPDDRDHYLGTFGRAFDAHQPFQMEYRRRRADGQYRWVLVSGVPRYAPDGSFAGYIGSEVDITDRKISEDALRDSQERYAMASAAGAVGVWDWNLETGEVYVDPTLKSLLGLEASPALMRADDWGSRVHAEDLAVVSAKVQACLDGASDEYEAEHRMVHRDGSVRWFLSRGTLSRRANGTPHRFVGTKVDITERKRAEEAIREQQAALRSSHREIQHLAGRLIAAQEMERARIARDLHDDTSQQLAGLGIALSGLKRRLSAVADVASLQEDVSSLQRRTMALSENVRLVSHDLHPSALEHSGLVGALTAYCAEVRSQQAVDVTFISGGDLELTDRALALSLYRVAQEALRNVVLHAHARRVHVWLRAEEDSVALTIADDGVGFDLTRAREHSDGLGLISMTERVNMAGGTVRISTALNQGTRLDIRVPVKPLGRPASDESGRYAAT